MRRAALSPVTMTEVSVGEDLLVALSHVFKFLLSFSMAELSNSNSHNHNKNYMRDIVTKCIVKCTVLPV